MTQRVHKSFETLHESFETLHENCEAPRSYFVPFRERDKFLIEDKYGIQDRTLSSRFISLCGTWDFEFSGKKDSLHDNVINKIIDVPSVWQFQGYDYHQYLNIPYPIPFDPPFAPKDNVKGVYERSFVISGDVEIERFLVFEGVDSCFYVYINDKFVGFSEVSHAMTEFNITEFVKEGTNKISVVVWKWSLGTYLEDQDKFRQSGIFRDVYILEREKLFIRDYKITTTLSSLDVDINFSCNHEPRHLQYTLFAPDLNFVEKGNISTGNIHIKINSPIFWNAEDPKLYTLILKYRGEVIIEKVGLRTVEIKKSLLLINGCPIKLLGVNRHDASPYTGPTVSIAEMALDLKLMKEHNINAIRTSHYPPDPRFLLLCEKMGFYVMEEADIETHGTIKVATTEEEGFPLISNDERFEKAMIDRVEAMIDRDKNKTAVIIWSMGNEAGFGVNTQKMLALTKRKDKSRLTHYEGANHTIYGDNFDGGAPCDFSNLDMWSYMYPWLSLIDDYFDNSTFQGKPLILCEFVHAMGNGPGSINEYMQKLNKYDRFTGFFVWEWADHAVYSGETSDGKAKFLYGDDFPDNEHSDHFCLDGLVSPDRKVTSGLLEYKNVIKRVTVQLVNYNADDGKGEFQIKNDFDFINLEDYIEITYIISKNGEPQHKDKLKPIDLSAKSCATFELEVIDVSDSENENSGNKDSAKTLDIRFVYSLCRPVSCLEKGHEIGFDQIILKKSKFTNPNIKEKIKKPPFQFKYNLTRAPIDNDRKVAALWDSSLPDIEEVWSKMSDDSYTVSYNVKFNDSLNLPPRFGIEVMLPKELQKIKYLGYGPYESYIDKHSASYWGVHACLLTDMYEDYIVPQEHGSRFGVDFFRLDGASEYFEVTGEGLSINASMYSQDVLKNTKHNFELVEGSKITLCIDGFMSGIGSSACGPPILDKYLMPKELSFKLNIKTNINFE